MAKKTVLFNSKGISTLPEEKPVVYKIFGHSIGSSDQHIANRVASNVDLEDLYVGLHGDPDSQGNQSIERRYLAWRFAGASLSPGEHAGVNLASNTLTATPRKFGERATPDRKVATHLLTRGVEAWSTIAPKLSWALGKKVSPWIGILLVAHTGAITSSATPFTIPSAASWVNSFTNSSTVANIPWLDRSSTLPRTSRVLGSRY